MAGKLIIGFLGTGKMATALARGFRDSGLVPPRQIIGSDPAPGARQAFKKATGGRITVRNAAVVESARVLILATKPDQAASVLREVHDQVTRRHLLISIAAGVPIATLEAALPSRSRVVRVMPNTPALVGAAAAGYALGKSATRADGQLVQRLLSTVGLAVCIKEALMDAVTGLSGSGPAYVYQFIEALSDGGVAVGLPREMATRLAAQTVLGAARMVIETGTHPGTLKDMVTSPGGTTIEGLHELEKGKLRATVMSAVRAAAEKSGKLGR
jgi:pyrroline-5-carboxylate reductase